MSNPPVKPTADRASRHPKHALNPAQTQPFRNGLLNRLANLPLVWGLRNQCSVAMTVVATEFLRPFVIPAISDQIDTATARAGRRYNCLYRLKGIVIDFPRSCVVSSEIKVLSHISCKTP